jgi:hypothetical protein
MVTGPRERRVFDRSNSEIGVQIPPVAWIGLYVRVFVCCVILCKQRYCDGPSKNRTKILKAFIVSELVLSRNRSERLSVDRRAVLLLVGDKVGSNLDFFNDDDEAQNYIARERLG